MRVSGLKATSAEAWGRATRTATIVLKNKLCQKVNFPQNLNLQPLDYRSIALPLELERMCSLMLNFGYLNPVPEVEFLRTSLASRAHFGVLGLEGQVLGLEASSPRKLPCTRLEKSTAFWINEVFFTSLEKFAWRPFFWEHLPPVSSVLGLGLEHSCPWPRAFLSLASRASVLGRAVLGLGFFSVLGLEPCVLDSTSCILWCW